MTKQETNAAQLTVHTCGPSRGDCICQCPDGLCGHEFDGPMVEFDNGFGMSATCSKCGMLAITHSMWVGP